MLTLLKRAVTVAAVAVCSLASAAEVRLQGGGATFPNPLYQRWVTEYGKKDPDAKIDYQSIGSGGGIKGFTEKTFDFAGSDAPMSAKELKTAGGENNVVEFPTCAGAVVPAYNVPGVKEELKFSGEVLADIYLGKINNWNDPKLAELNPGVKLPDKAITPVWRNDGSGTTFVFTNYLATQSDEFKGSVGVGKQVQWPIGSGAKGNDGVSAAVQQTAGGIGYIEENYADHNKIPYGLMRNRDGKFIKASSETVSAAGAGAVQAMKGHILAADIWNQPGEKAYPISSFTYLIVYKDLNNLKSKEQAQALVDFMWWASHDGQKLAPELGYAPLADAVQKNVENALNSLSFKGEALKPSIASAK